MAKGCRNPLIIGSRFPSSETGTHAYDASQVAIPSSSGLGFLRYYRLANGGVETLSQSPHHRVSVSFNP